MELTKTVTNGSPRTEEDTDFASYFNSKSTGLVFHIPNILLNTPSNFLSKSLEDFCVL